ncbi:hypothetical protein C7S20_18395 [Christiangramia fulva]|uniref:J domain-containing protein n=1 Tax=Christiangramia fulva TaxID=2126553 RepID=A0A2R3Z9U1_9FLAO|nr:DnaJ domain-containing protein [Christiangramia fulva]AVR47058.1 hypothetical protein C7S20_18395 [Christiangramia fulva]
MADYYKILGVSRSASKSEIERAFYKIKSKFSSEDVEDPFFKNYYRRILEAYNILSNEKLRSQYDKNLPVERSENSISERKPIIEYFKTNNEKVEPGGKIILSWHTSFADKISLRPFGQVGSTGSKIIYFKDLDNENLLFTLQAVNTKSGQEVVKNLHVKKHLEEEKKKVDDTIKKPPTVEKSKENIEIPTPEVNDRRTSTPSKLKKYGIPGGIGILCLAIFLFFIGKSGFWRSDNNKILEESISNYREKKAQRESNDVVIEKEEKLFVEKSDNLNGKVIKYYDPVEVMTKLLAEMESNSVPGSVGFEADMRQFFNGSSNPLNWKSSKSGKSQVLNSQIKVGITQNAFSEDRDPVLEVLSLKKTSDNDSRKLNSISFQIGDSGPPFWEPDNKWNAFDKIWRSNVDKILVTDELNRKYELYSLNQIPPGFSAGYLQTSNHFEIPVSFLKEISEENPTSIQIKFYSSMNDLMREGYLSRNEKEERIWNLLELENNRDFNLISQFYADNIKRYWDNYEVGVQKLNELYQSAWSNTSFSENEIQDVVMLDEINFEVITNFKYVNKEGDTISQLGSTHYSFNEDGLIDEVYGFDSDYTYKSFRDSDFDSMTEEIKIRRLLKTEDLRNFNKIASYYSADMKRYWYVEDPSFKRIHDIYKDAWDATSYSKNIILNIEKSGYKTYDVHVRFEFYNDKENRAEAKESFTRYVFNNKGFIEEVYGLDKI